MNMRLWIALVFLFSAVPAAAQDPAEPPRDPIAERIDRYRFNPRAPGTYRALAGLGDPDADSAPEPSEPVSSRQRSLLARMLPDQRPIDSEYWWANPGECRIDYALRVAEARAARLGASHPYIDQWLRTQRAVFSACRPDQWSSTEPPRPARALPPPLATDDPAIARLQREDRAYQDASLLFYRGDPGARAAFAAIARTASPHARIARYMVAASNVRASDFYGGSSPGDDRTNLGAGARRALADARAILADPDLGEIHGLAQGLIGFLGWHIRDEPIRRAQMDATLDALEAPIARIRRDEGARDRYDRAVADIPWLQRGFEDPAWWLRGTAPADASTSRAMAAEARTRPLAAFLLFPVPASERKPWIRGQSRYGPWYLLVEHAEAQTERETGEAWALIQDSLTDHYEPHQWAAFDTLVREIRADPTDRRLAAVATRFYHAVRRALMYNAEPGQRAAAFREALARVESWPWRDSRHHRELVFDMLRYLVARGRLAEARQLRDRTDPRHSDYYGATTPMLLLLAENEGQLAREVAALPERGQELLNLLSTRALARLAARREVPLEVRARFARVAWTRLYALGRRIPEPLDRGMRALNPEITSGSPGLNILLVDHQRAAGRHSNYADNPGLNGIDTLEHSDNNWWCAWQPQRHETQAYAALYDSFYAPDDERAERDPLAVAGVAAGLRPLLGESYLWRSRDDGETEALAQIPSAPQTLAERAVAWSGPGSAAGQDEALALAVRATRYGCQRQGGHGRWSAAAHRLLHQRFPGSKAARRTRWWFDRSHFSGGYAALEEPDQWERWTGRRYWTLY
jgi:hypothetical protein